MDDLLPSCMFDALQSGFQVVGAVVLVRGAGGWAEAAAQYRLGASPGVQRFVPYAHVRKTAAWLHNACTMPTLDAAHPRRTRWRAGCPSLRGC